MEIEAVEQWADCHNTDIEVAEAIFYCASYKEDLAENIWADPTLEQWRAVWARVTNNGLHDGDEYAWGVEPLGNTYKGVSE